MTKNSLTWCRLSPRRANTGWEQAENSSSKHASSPFPLNCVLLTDSAIVVRHVVLYVVSLHRPFGWGQYRGGGMGWGGCDGIKGGSPPGTEIRASCDVCITSPWQRLVTCHTNKVMWFFNGRAQTVAHPSVPVASLFPLPMLNILEIFPFFPLLLPLCGCVVSIEISEELDVRPASNNPSTALVK